MRKILFVCLGNICRSPAAKGMVRTLMPQAQLDSAGTSSWHVGEPPYAPMQTAAKARGVDLGNLRARQFTATDYDAFDLIVAMDASNMEQIEALRPAGSETPVHLFTDYAPQMGTSEVPDPYYTRDFDGTLDLIALCAQGLQASIQQAQ